MAELTQPPVPAGQPRHAGWVRGCHLVAGLSVLVLIGTGYVILKCHPRLYWGEVGNDLTPALLELPISKNHRHGGWRANEPFPEHPGTAASASRTFEIYNENAWGRSLHFLAAWVLVAAGAVYLLAGAATGHFRRHLWPGDDLTARGLWRDAANHLRGRLPPATGGPQYGLLQRCAYYGVVFVALPLTVLSGLAMSPAVSAAYPALGGLFGGFQSARTVHFAATVALVLFLIVHVVMVVRTGFWRQVRGITIGRAP